MQENFESSGNGMQLQRGEEAVDNKFALGKVFIEETHLGNSKSGYWRPGERICREVLSREEVEVRTTQEVFPGEDSSVWSLD